MDYTAEIKDYISLEIETLQKLDTLKINEVMNKIEDTRAKKGNIYIMGNGGSAATASHYCNDFNKGVGEYLDNPYRFICLNDNIATVMAIANDIGYDSVFEFQLRGKVTENDLVIGISGSGNSPNVLKAIEFAKSANAETIGITGYNGGKLGETADIHLNVPVMSMQITEDLHMIFDHLMMSIFYKKLCGIDHLKKD
jgi:D-sedoheptulose 7-phosphate isomerase